MLALVVVSVPIAFLNMLNQIIALQLLSGSDFLKAFEPEQAEHSRNGISQFIHRRNRRC